MAAVSIRRAAAGDIDEAARLFVGYLRFYGRSSAEADARAFVADRLERRDSVLFLAEAEAESRALGFVQLYPAFASLSLAPSWILNDLFVDPEARGRGVGKALVAAARRLAQDNGAAELMLQTARDNHVAQRLYERLGWKRDDEFLVYTFDPRPTARP